MSNGYGQTPDPASLIVSVDFSIVGWGAAFPTIEYVKDGQRQSLGVPAFARSETVHYTGKAKLELFLKVAQDGKLVDAVVAAPVLNPDDKRVIILLAPPINGKSAFKLLPSPKPGTFNNGMLRVCNFCPTRLAIKSNNGGITVLPPDSTRIFEPINGGLTFVTAYEEAGKWRGLHELRMGLPSDQETTLLYFKSDFEMFQSNGGITDPIQSVTLIEKRLIDEKPHRVASLAGR